MARGEDVYKAEAILGGNMADQPAAVDQHPGLPAPPSPVPSDVYHVRHLDRRRVLPRRLDHYNNR